MSAYHMLSMCIGSQLCTFYDLFIECGTEKHCSAFHLSSIRNNNGYTKVVAVLLLGQYIPSTGYEPKKRDRIRTHFTVDKTLLAQGDFGGSPKGDSQ